MGGKNLEVNSRLKRSTSVSALSGDKLAFSHSCQFLHVDGSIQSEQKALSLHSQCPFNGFAMKIDSVT